MARFARAATKAFDQGIGTLAAGGHIWQVGGTRSVTGLSITTDKALRYGPFWAAVNLISEDMAKLPLGVHEQLPDGTNRPAPEHPLAPVIGYRPNPRVDHFRWLQTGMAHDLTWGNAYSGIIRDGKGAIAELWTMATDRMELGSYPDGSTKFGYTRADGEKLDLTSAEVFHVPGLAWDGIQGYSVVRLARETIGLGLAAEEHGARFFGNGATTNIALTSPKGLSDTAWNHLTASVTERKTGLENAWKPWILEEGLTPTTLSMPHDDAQWLETRKHQVTEVARWFRIPPHKLADLEHATFSNIEEQSLEYVTDCLMGWITRWEMAIGMQLLGDDWVGAGGRFYVKFNVNALLRGDFETRMKGYAMLSQWGLISADQVDALEEWPKQPNGAGATALRPLTHVAVTDLDNHGMTFEDRVNAAAVLVRSGYEPEGPDGVNAALGLPPIKHTGLVPVTVQADPAATSKRDAALAAAAAAGGGASE